MPNARSAKSAREKAAEMRAEAERVAARRRAVIVGAAVLAAIAVVIGGYVAFQSFSKQERDRKAAAAAPPANLYTGVSAVGGGLLVGVGPTNDTSKNTAKVTVDIYEDFLCPICRDFEAANGPILKKYSDEGKIKLVYHPVSILDRASNGTRYSTRAANALATVINTTPSAALAYHSLLFENQPEEGSSGLSDATLLDLAAKAGANRTAIEADVTKIRFEGWVTSRTEKFTQVFPPGGTPTVAVDGQKVADLAPATITSTIEAALKK